MSDSSRALWSHLRGQFVSAKLVPARAAAGRKNLLELAPAKPWEPAPLEMVDFSTPASVRQARLTTSAQYSAEFHSVRLVSGMAGFADIRSKEYVCDAVFENLGRLKNAWYEDYGLKISDNYDCQFYCGVGESLHVSHAISFFGWANGNFAHWLSEKLPRFFWINQAAIPEQTVVLVEAGLPSSIMESLAIFWPRERIVCVERGHACDVGVLYHFSDSAEIWEPKVGYVYRGDEYRVCPTAIAWMANYVKAHCGGEGTDSNKTYLIRPPGGNGRNIVNQQALVTELQRDGFQLLRPETKSFSQQVRSLSSTGLAILGSGAAAANLLWMAPGSTMVILIQDTPLMWYWFFQALAAAVGVRLVYFPVIGHAGTSKVIFHWNVEIPIAELQRWLVTDEPVRQASLAAVGEASALQDADRFFDELSLLRQGHRAKQQLFGVQDPTTGIGNAAVSDQAEEGHGTVPSDAQTPLVSVCISAYNHEAYIAEAIESVLAQTYLNVELIVVDDASSDATPAIVMDYAKRFPQRMRAILLRDNEGPARAPNRAFAEARGEFIALLGSDDRMRSQRIQLQVRFLLDNPGCVGVFSDIDAIDGEGLRSQSLSGTEMLFNQPIVHLRRQLLTGNFLNAPSALIRKADLLAVGGYTPVLRYVQDYELWGRLLARGELAKLPEPLTEYRVHGANLSVFGQGGANFAARCETVATIVRFVKSWPLESLLEQPLESDADRAAALLELAMVLERVDRHYFNKPLLACALAYDLVLQASQLVPGIGQEFKLHLDDCLDEGFRAERLPFERETVWFAEPCALLSRALSLSGAERPASRLQDWLAARVPTQAQNRLIDEYLQQHEGGPCFGILVLDLEGDPKRLMTTINSLQPNREQQARLKIIALTPGEVPVTSAADKLHFIRIDSANHVPALNAAVEEGDFDWLMLVQAGEEFTVSGLLMMALELIGAPGCRAVYGDELQRLHDGRLGATFRPAFNLDLLISFPTAMARHWLVRRDVFIDAGGFDAAFVGALEFELLLRLIEQEGMAGLGHIDEPLLIATAQGLVDNPAEIAALEGHLQRRGYDAQLLPYLPGRYRVHYGHRSEPLVSIIIPTKDQLPILQRCVESLLEKTRYPHYELLIVDNNSETVEAREWFDAVERMGEEKVRILRYPHPFNYSAINNMAAGQARGDYLVLLNNDTAIIREDWLDELLNHAQRPEVGIVGAKLLYPDGLIQHAGVVLGLRGPADHPFIGEPMDAPGYMQRLQVDQNYSAVTAACLMIRKSLYEEIGGMDEEAFKVSYNDVDLCLKVRETGYLTVWTPHAVVMHEGSVSQTKVDTAAQEAKLKRFIGEQDALYAKWLPILARDPAYNRNLSLNGRGFELEPDINLSWRPLAWRPLPTVLAHPADPWGCGNYRIIKPFQALRDATLVDGMLSEGLLHVADLQRYDPDVIVLQRQIGDERLEAMRRIKQFSRAFKVYELDDYLPNLPIKSVHRDQMPRDILKSLRRGLSYVDRFVVSTAPLADALSGFHPDIRVIENRLPVDWWKGLSSRRRRGQKPRVGWAGGIGHTGDLELIADVIRELASEVEWVFFGMCPEKIRPYVHEMHVGVDIEGYSAALAALDLDLALAPVEQNLFNDCKSNLRLLEYGACGFPVICSDVLCYRGDLAVTRVKNRYKDWVDAIRMHINDLDAAAKLGDELRAQVLAKWMLEAGNAEAWRAAWLPG